MLKLEMSRSESGIGIFRIQGFSGVSWQSAVGFPLAVRRRGWETVSDSGDREVGERWRGKCGGMEVGRSQKVSMEEGRGTDSRSLLLGAFLWEKSSIL